MRTHNIKCNKWYTHYVRVCVKTLTNINRKNRQNRHPLYTGAYIRKSNKSRCYKIRVCIHRFIDIWGHTTHTYTRVQDQAPKCMKMYESMHVRKCTNMYGYTRIYTRKRCHNNDVKWCHKHTYAKIYFYIF